MNPVFANDYTTNVRLISRMTKNGRTRQSACALVAAGIFAVLLSIATYLPNALWMTRRFDMEIRQISVHSIMGLQGLIALLYINGWWMLMALMRALGMLLSAGVVLLFLRICKKHARRSRVFVRVPVVPADSAYAGRDWELGDSLFSLWIFREINFIVYYQT